MAKTPTKFDKRLIGTWKSDRRKTFQHYKPRKSYSQSRYRRLKELFGKLVIRWGRTKAYSNYDGTVGSDRYEIVASDETSVVIWYTDPITGVKELKQIHFEGDYYWLSLDGHLAEWFRRIQ